MALVTTPPIRPDEQCPDFELEDLWGRNFRQSDFFKNNKGVLIMFICNHCPYVKAIEDRLIVLAKDLKDLQIECVAICSNEDSSYPEDAPPALKARAELKKYPFNYLHDPSQIVAKKFDAVCTPDFFLYDQSGKLFYRGRLDDSWKDPNLVTQRELLAAAQILVKAQADPSTKADLPFPMKPSMGCSIKWKN